MTTTTSFQGSKFYLQKGLDASKKITAMTIKPATITIASNGYAKGDMILISDLGSMDGYYPIKSVDASTGVITLADEVNWSSFDTVTKFTNATAAKVQFHDNFCAIKNFDQDGSTLAEEDVTTMCSDGEETEPGEITHGSLKLTFFLNFGSDVQQALRDKFYNKESFAYKLVLKENRGSLFGTGFVQTSMNLSGEVKGKWDSGVTIKMAKRDYLLPAA
ncbi:hypothetical protein [Lonepinella sp. MS14436]|uniref:hypothetical protein n=1 Tax=Lonepinella sp. MS14436 TaxID=3003619 RepID=UPI0036D7755B